MSTTTIYVPRDSAALAVGADDVAVALQAECARRGLAIEAFLEKYEHAPVPA